MKKIVLIGIFSLFLSACSFPFTLPWQKTPVGQEVDLTQPGGDTRLTKFFENFSQIKSYRTTIQTSADQASKIIMEYQAPDTTHTYIESDQGTTENIFTPEASYTKAPNSDTWYKMEVQKADEAQDYQFNTEDLKKDFYEDSPTMTYLGEKPCGDLTCHAYQSSIEDITTIIYFDTSDYLIRLIETQVSDGSTSTITYGSFNQITIDIPTNVQEFAIPENPSLEDIQKLQELY